MIRIRTFWLWLFLVLGVSLPVQPQGAALGKLRLLVTDSQGRPLTAAAVTLRDVQENSARLHAVTNGRGVMIQSGIINHLFEVTVEKTGYQTERRSLKIPAGLLLEETVALSTLEEAQRRETGRDPQGAAVAAFNRAAQLINEKKLEEALADLQEAIRLDPAIYQAYFYSGQVKFQLSRFAEALPDLQQAYALQSDDPQLLRLLAAVHEKLGHRAEMESFTKMAQEKGGKTPIDLYNEGIAALNANDNGAALAAFEQAIAADPAFADAHYQAGLCELNRGGNEKAAAHLAGYLELKPEGENAAAARAILESLRKWNPQK